MSGELDYFIDLVGRMVELNADSLGEDGGVLTKAEMHQADGLYARKVPVDQAAKYLLRARDGVKE